MSLIKIENLSKTYINKNGQHFTALDNINLEIENNSFVALLGVNGAGKSTLINILASIILKTSGKITIDETIMEDDISRVKSKIGIVLQDVNLDPTLNVIQILNLYSLYYGLHRNKEYVRHILNILDLYDKRFSYPRQLSGGMKRRLLIAKAMVHNPEILLLDEPSAGIDVDQREKMWEIVKDLHVKESKTIILTTHYLEEAIRLCERIVILKSGKIICDKSKESLSHEFSQEMIYIRLSNSEDIHKAVELIINDFNIKPILNELSDGVIQVPNNSSVQKVIAAFYINKIFIESIQSKKNSLERVIVDLMKG